MKYTKTLMGLSLAGTLFAGYLAGVKLLTHTCSALVGSCSYFLGIPTCVYGFFFFAVLFILSVEMHRTGRKLHRVIAAVAFGAMFFSGYFTITEWLQSGPFPLGAPTCFYGLLVFIAVFLFAASAIEKK